MSSDSVCSGRLGVFHSSFLSFPDPRARDQPPAAAMGIGEHFEGVKQHWASNFAFLDYYKKVYGRAEPLPKWSDADVDEFIASDPVYGPQVGAPLLSPFLLASPIL